MLSEPASPEPSPLAEPILVIAETHPRTIAPLWHTLLLIAVIAAYSFWGAQAWHPPALDPLAPVAHNAKQTIHQSPGTGLDLQRLTRYAFSGGLELVVVAWVWLGLRLRRVPLRSLFGKIPRTLNDITLEAGIAGLFWLSAMTVLLVLALLWQLGATAVYHHQEQQAKQHQSQPTSPSAPKPESPEKKQLDTVRELLDLAPANGIEIVAWGALCLIVGFSEELAFRGYLQSQGIALFQRIPLGVCLSAIVFGFAHGYQGLRGMVLIGAFGAMFSILTLIRRSLFAGILAHAWHDFLMGLLLALVRATHMIDKLMPTS
jgi:membrane protease YdiL (CAAX protease family)